MRKLSNGSNGSFERLKMELSSAKLDSDSSSNSVSENSSANFSMNREEELKVPVCDCYSARQNNLQSI